MVRDVAYNALNEPLNIRLTRKTNAINLTSRVSHLTSRVLRLPSRISRLKSSLTFPQSLHPPKSAIHHSFRGTQSNGVVIYPNDNSCKDFNS